MAMAVKALSYSPSLFPPHIRFSKKFFKALRPAPPNFPPFAQYVAFSFFYSVFFFFIEKQRECQSASARPWTKAVQGGSTPSALTFVFENFFQKLTCGGNDKGECPLPSPRFAQPLPMPLHYLRPSRYHTRTHPRAMSLPHRYAANESHPHALPPPLFPIPASLIPLPHGPTSHNPQQYAPMQKAPSPVVLVGNQRPTPSLASPLHQ